MRALITNDDGIDAQGLHVLARAAVQAGLDVLVAAPHIERSGFGTGLTSMASAGRLLLTANSLTPTLGAVAAFAGAAAGFALGLALEPGRSRDATILAVGAILSADFPMAQGTIIVLSLGFILINLVVDVLYAALDPRMRTA